MAPLQRHPVYRDSSLNPHDKALIQCMIDKAIDQHTHENMRHGTAGVIVMALLMGISGMVGYLLH